MSVAVVTKTTDNKLWDVFFNPSRITIDEENDAIVIHDAAGNVSAFTSKMNPQLIAKQVDEHKDIIYIEDVKEELIAGDFEPPRGYHTANTLDDISHTLSLMAEYNN